MTLKNSFRCFPLVPASRLIAVTIEESAFKDPILRISQRPSGNPVMVDVHLLIYSSSYRQPLTFKPIKMKKQILPFVPLFFAAMTFVSNTHAQVDKGSLEFSLKELVYNEAVANSALAADASASKVRARAMKDFSRAFKNAPTANWFQMKDGFLARFRENEIETNAYYDLKGRWSGTVRNYGEAQLPKQVRNQVKSMYFDYSIYLVHELTVGNQLVYLVKIQDKDSLKTIRIIDGEMDLYEDYKKG